ncbi:MULTISPECIES: nuclear transport factor 2 family protein [unclassified Chelatococcus]|uniref:nuclear transport factor 2 family protein n=1 Tax=unclassified Chelatococcus TaxID=2638111 RepID=UPI001BCAC103|nr:MULTISPECIES: nuclear transport factor 2 family protein [unclassified Chelatococcus]MBS7741411.1 nuclear transport factor 2 family protein [Chelatococcus sp. HY11]MBX3546107.1 nuclear transport factor 2 family protein [Chelatococcus sp.]MCO5077244.1 nuclear transport factor 2 family protein [Chelatococcus sp.]
MTSLSPLIAIAAASLATAAFIPVAQANKSSGKENKTIVQRSFDAWAAGTGSPYDLLAEDAVWTITGNSLASKTYPSREAFLGQVIRPFVERMSVGLKPVIRDIYSDGTTVIIHFDAAGTAKDGKPYVNTYAWFLDMQDGKIVKATAFYDSIAFNDLWTRVKLNQ